METKGPELMGQPAIRFSVYGQQYPQGSKVSQVLCDRNGDPVRKNGRIVTIAREDNPKTFAWRQEVASAARAAYDGPLLLGPVLLVVRFIRQRPAGHFGTGRNLGLVKGSAPSCPTSTPDSLKLARAVEDAIAGVVYRNDSQVVRHSISKEYGKAYLTLVEVVELP